MCGCKFSTCTCLRQDGNLVATRERERAWSPSAGTVPCSLPARCIVHHKKTRAGSPDTEVSSQGASANVAHHHPSLFRRAAQRTQVSGEPTRRGFNEPWIGGRPTSACPARSVEPRTRPPRQWHGICLPPFDISHHPPAQTVETNGPRHLSAAECRKELIT